MHTQAEATAYKAYFSKFIQQCADYRALLTKHNLPLLVDLNQIKAAYRRQLFDKLLEIDQPRKMRYDMLCTDEGKERLINDTIDITGHPIIDEVSALLSEIQLYYSNQIDLPRSGTLSREMSLRAFAESYGLDLARVIDARTVKWAGAEHVLDYFQSITAELTCLRNITDSLVRAGAGMQEIGLLLHHAFNVDPETKKVVVDEIGLYSHVLRGLQEKGADRSFPRNMR